MYQAHQKKGQSQSRVQDGWTGIKGGLQDWASLHDVDDPGYIGRRSGRTRDSAIVPATAAGQADPPQPPSRKHRKARIRKAASLSTRQSPSASFGNANSASTRQGSASAGLAFVGDARTQAAASKPATDYLPITQEQYNSIVGFPVPPAATQDQVTTNVNGITSPNLPASGHGPNNQGLYVVPGPDHVVHSIEASTPLEPQGNFDLGEGALNDFAAQDSSSMERFAGVASTTQQATNTFADAGTQQRLLSPDVDLLDPALFASDTQTPAPLFPPDPHQQQQYAAPATSNTLAPASSLPSAPATQQPTSAPRDGINPALLFAPPATGPSVSEETYDKFLASVTNGDTSTATNDNNPGGANPAITNAVDTGYSASYHPFPGDPAAALQAALANGDHDDFPGYDTQSSHGYNGDDDDSALGSDFGGGFSRSPSPSAAFPNLPTDGDMGFCY